MVLFRSEFSRAIQKRHKKVDLTKKNACGSNQPKNHTRFIGKCRAFSGHQVTIFEDDKIFVIFLNFGMSENSES